MAFTLPNDFKNQPQLPGEHSRIVCVVDHNGVLLREDLAPDAKERFTADYFHFATLYYTHRWHAGKTVLLVLWRDGNFKFGSTIFDRKGHKLYSHEIVFTEYSRWLSTVRA